MAGGKRLDKRKRALQHQRNGMSITGKIHLIPYTDTDDNDSNSTCIAVEDTENTAWPRHSQNSKRASMSPKIPKGEKDTMTDEKFDWKLVGASILFFSIIGAILYSFFAPLITYTVGAIGIIFTIFPLDSFLPPKLSKAWNNVRKPLKFGLVVSLIIVVIFCGYLGWRLDFTVSTSPPDSSPTVEAEETPMVSEPQGDTPDTEDDSGDSSSVPPVITPHPNKADEVLRRMQTDFFGLIDYDTTCDTVFEPDEMSVWQDEFASKIAERLFTKKWSKIDSVGMRKFEQKTKDANDLFGLLSNKDDKVVANKDIIQLREEAYDLMPTMSLCDLLANDYKRLANAYKKAGDQESSYINYCNAVKWKLIGIQFQQQLDDSYYSALYFIATTYSQIGSLDSMPDSDRIDANYISSCLFGIVSQHTFAKGNTQYLSCLYGGMATHSLFNLYANLDLSERFVYFSAACDYYLDALDFSSKDSKSICEYLYVLYNWAATISQAHPGGISMEKPATYKVLAEEYRQRSL